MNLFHWIIIGQAILVLAFVMIYASGFAGGGMAAGIRLGIMLEILAIGARIIMYAVQPLPARLIVYWSVGGLIEMIVTGAIVGAGTGHLQGNQLARWGAQAASLSVSAACRDVLGNFRSPREVLQASCRRPRTGSPRSPESANAC